MPDPAAVRALLDLGTPGLLLVGLLLTPLAIVVFVYWFLRRRGLPTRQEQPDTIDYDKW